MARALQREVGDDVPLAKVGRSEASRATEGAVG